MRQRRHGTKSLVLLFGMLGAMLISSTAQAETTGLFQENSGTISALKNLRAELTVPAYFILPGIEVGVECEEFTETGQLHPGGLISTASLFKGCKVVGAETCTLYPTLHARTLGTAHGLLFLTGSGKILKHLVDLGGGVKHMVRYILLLGDPFGSLIIGDALGFPGECPFSGLDLTVKGSVAFEVPDALTSQLTHHFKSVTSAATESLLKVGLTIGAEPAKAEMLVNAFLLTDENWSLH